MSRFDNSSMSSSEETSFQNIAEVKDGNHTRCTAPLEQEDSRQGATKRAVSLVTIVRWRKLFTAVMHLVAYTLLNAGIAMIEPFYPIVAQQHNVAIYVAGVVIGTGPLCVAVGSPLVGYFLPHLGLKFAQLAGLFLTAGSLILFGFVTKMPTPTLFVVFSFLLRIVEGVGTAVYTTAFCTQLLQLYPDKKGTIVGLMELSLALGSAIGPAIAGILQEVGGFVLPFLVVGSCIIVLMPVLMVLVRPSECTSVKLPWKLFLRLFSNIVFVLLAVALILSVSTIDAVLTYTAQFLHQQFNLSMGIVGVIYMSIILMYTLGTLVAGQLTERLFVITCVYFCILQAIKSLRWGTRLIQARMLSCSKVTATIIPSIYRVPQKTPRCLIITGMVVTSAAGAFIGPPTFITTPKLWLTTLTCCVFGAGAAFAIVPIYSDMYENTKTLHETDEAVVTSTLSGILVGSDSAGECLGPVIGGALVYKVGFRLMPTIVSLMLLVYTLVLIIVTVIQRCWKPCWKLKQ